MVSWASRFYSGLTLWQVPKPLKIINGFLIYDSLIMDPRNSIILEFLGTGRPPVSCPSRTYIGAWVLLHPATVYTRGHDEACVTVTQILKIIQLVH